MTLDYNLTEDDIAFLSRLASSNGSLHDSLYKPDKPLEVDFFKDYPEVQWGLYILYSIIFIIGMFGNILVLYVVVKFKNMRTITNRFIACLSISDLLICMFAIPFTPINAFIPEWIFGEVLCKLVPMLQGASVFVSTLTSVVIAVDRYIVIAHPHTPRMSLKIQIIILISIWLMALSTAIPIGYFITLENAQSGDGKECRERWPNNYSPHVYTWVVFVLQLVLPAIIISLCYIRVSYQLHQRQKARQGNRDYQRVKMDANRTKRINRMFIAMITIFILCWLPLNMFHLQLISHIIKQRYKLLVFILFHLVAMSSVMYNPFLYGWMNENFNRHFMELWRSLKTCCHKSRCMSGSQTDDPSQTSNVINIQSIHAQHESPNMDKKDPNKYHKYEVIGEQAPINATSSTSTPKDYQTSASIPLLKKSTEMDADSYVDVEHSAQLHADDEITAESQPL